MAAAHARSDFAECQRLCEAALKQQPGDARALVLLGMVAVQTRQLELAMTVLPRAAAANPREPLAHAYLGAAQLLLGRPAAALASTGRALKLKPDDALTLNLRACALGNLNRHRASLAACDRALQIKPDYAEVLVNRGNALAQLNRPQDALDSFERARRARPDFVQAINNCANALKQLRRFDEALQRYDEALALQPDFAEAAYNRGVALAELGRPREALRSYQRALQIEPANLDARCNLAHCRLQLGHYAQGWKDFEAQWQASLRAGRGRVWRQPLWRGESPLRGRTVLLHAEAGLGDTLQFCRYARRVAARGARVVLEVQRPLLRLLSKGTGAHRVIAAGTRRPAFDWHCPLMQLPRAFDTRLDNVPAATPYVRSDPALAARWKKRLGHDAMRGRPRIGLVWSGNPAHGNDGNRSLALADMLPLLRFDACWVSLQQTVRERDAAVLAAHPQITHFGARLRDFADTAALVKHLDLVIAVDTSVAHLAGAMGKPLWLLLPFNPDWRWLLRRRDSPWYPGARLFRQRVAGGWPDVIDAVGRALSRQRQF